MRNKTTRRKGPLIGGHSRPPCGRLASKRGVAGGWRPSLFAQMTCPSFHSHEYDKLLLLPLRVEPGWGSTRGKGRRLGRLPLAQLCRSLLLASPRTLQFLYPRLLCALLVVLDPRGRDLTPGIEQIRKPAHRQTFFPQPSVKTLDVRVLHGFAWLREDFQVREERWVTTSDWRTLEVVTAPKPTYVDRFQKLMDHLQT